MTFGYIGRDLTSGSPAFEVTKSSSNQIHLTEALYRCHVADG